MPVVEHYKKEGKVVEVDSTKSIDDVFKDILAAIDPVLEKAQQK